MWKWDSAHEIFSAELRVLVLFCIQHSGSKHDILLPCRKAIRMTFEEKGMPVLPNWVTLGATFPFTGNCHHHSPLLECKSVPFVPQNEGAIDHWVFSGTSSYTSRTFCRESFKKIWELPMRPYKVSSCFPQQHPSICPYYSQCFSLQTTLYSNSQVKSCVYKVPYFPAQ